MQIKEATRSKLTCFPQFISEHQTKHTLTSKYVIKMKCALFLVCLFLTCLHLQAKDLVVGSRVNNLLVSTEKIVFKSIPFYRRDKDYVYVDQKNRIIKVRYVFGAQITVLPRSYRFYCFIVSKIQETALRFYVG